MVAFSVANPQNCAGFFRLCCVYEVTVFPSAPHSYAAEGATSHLYYVEMKIILLFAVG